MSLSFGSLFSGIGGFDLGLERAGFEIAWQVENDPFCNKVLAKHWPGVKRYGDIKQVRGEELEAVALIAGGPPCQPASVAGKRKGTQDNRWLWPETLRIVREVNPAWCLFENPTGILSLQGGIPFESVFLALEDEGYEVSAFIIPACAIGAPHRRDRIWIIAHAINAGMRRRNNGIAQRMQSTLQTQGSGSFFTSHSQSRESHSSEPKGFHPEPCSKNPNVANPPIHGDGRYSGIQENRQIQQSGNGVKPGIVANPNGFNGNNGRFGSSEVSQFQEAGISGFNSANADQPGSQIGEVFGRNLSEKLQAPIRNPWQEHWDEAATRLCGISHGIFRGMDRHRTKRLKALGNAVVPGLVEIFGRMIIEVESTS